MKEKTCCFTGHREISSEEQPFIKKRIIAEAIKLIDRGVVYFGTGGARGFDALASEAILELKSNYPQVKLILVLPCANQTKFWHQRDIIIHRRISAGADKIRILSGNYYPGCMHYRNRYLIDHSSYCICYRRKNTGGTAYTVSYAKQQGVEIIPL